MQPNGHIAVYTRTSGCMMNAGCSESTHRSGATLCLVWAHLALGVGSSTEGRATLAFRGGGHDAVTMQMVSEPSYLYMGFSPRSGAARAPELGLLAWGSLTITSMHLLRVSHAMIHYPVTV